MSRPLSLRARLIAVIALGAVLPLAIVGVWLTRSAERAGDALLRSELESSAAAVTEAIRSRWQVREGELLLLARNDVIRHALAQPAGTPLASDDSAYLESLAADTRRAFTSIQYHDSARRPRWRFPATTAATRSDGPTIDVRRDITSDAGETLGSVDATVLLRSLVPADSLTVGIIGARVAVLDSATSVPLLVTPATADALAQTDSTPGWLRASSAISTLPLRVVVSAPSAPYVVPFQRSARIGLAVLMLVAIGTLAVSSVIVARVGRALVRLADASDAVAGGDLERAVSWKDDDEIGRVARAFNRMTDSLRRTLEELAERRALAAVGEFAASLSHEVRNSLTAIRVDLQHAERRAGEDTKERELIARALSNVRRLDSTVTGSLRAARGDALERAPVDLRDVIASAAMEAKPVFEASAALLDVTSPQDPLPVNGNATALQQLFLNLLLNAGQSLPRGGVTSVSMTEVKGLAEVCIADSGSGMHADTVERLGDSLYTSKPDGTGLGVRIARRIAQTHGGEIVYASAAGAGTVVRVTLPLVLPHS